MSEQLPSDARVFAVASGKGGVGKTTTAVNLGATLAESGAEVVVVDADLGMANVADLLDLSVSGPTLQDVLAAEVAVEKATYRSHEGLAVVPGTADLDSYAAVDPDRLGEVVDALREEFEYVFLDAGAGLSHDSVLPLGLADAVVLVTTPREPAARDAGKTREVAERIDATVGGVVVTRVREEPAELDPDAIAERVGAPVLTAVPEDGVVRKALAAGRPTVMHAPQSLVTTAYRRIAAALTGRESVEPAVEATEPSDVDDATSIDELLEREADRSTDVSALTGDSAARDDDPTAEDDPADEGSDSADDPPTPDLEDGADSSDPLAADLEPSNDLGEDPADEEYVGTGTDGDILIAEETPSDADEEPAADSEPAEGPDASESDDDDDPLADIPRFEDESDEEFIRGGKTADPLAADPADDGAALADDAGSGEVEPPTDAGDELADGDDFADEVETSVEGEASLEDEASVEAKPDEAGEEDAVGPQVEVDEPDDGDGGGLLGRLAGLFR